MDKFDTDQYFSNILEERRSKSDLNWVTRDFNPKKSYDNSWNFTPSAIKSITLKSYRLNKILKMISQQKQVPLETLHKMVEGILEEIGYNRKVPIMRWLALVVTKILKKILSGVYVNETKFLQIKAEMGGNPLLFIPSHKSYCDFILLSYLCFGYDVDPPRVAAGMDFHSMVVLGNLLRDVCAFYMRRSFVSDELYSAVFSQYVQTLITYGTGAVEFFIEGTRSRTQKTLMPKFGFLSMALKPFLIGLVPDITIVPVTLSYDRVLEEVLFVYELLGVPKPKESTKGFLKVWNILDENYGNVYVNFGDPFSVKEYFKNKIDRSDHSFGAVEMQELTQDETKHIIHLAHHIVHIQKELTVLTCFNLIATILNNYLLTSQEPLFLDGLVLEVQWLFSVLKVLAPKTFVWPMTSINEELVVHHIKLHKVLICLSSDKRIQLCRIHSANLHSEKQLKGYKLSNGTMDVATIFLMLQYYSNPCAAFLVGVCLISLIVESLSKEGLLSKGLDRSLRTDDTLRGNKLLNDFKFLCSIFSHEFVFHNDFINKDFEDAFNHSENLEIIKLIDENNLERGNNEKLRLFCIRFLSPYFPAVMSVIEVLLKSVGISFAEKEILKTCQERLELKLNNENVIHPANLSLDLLTNTLQSLQSVNGVFKSKGKNGIVYQANLEELEKIYDKLRDYDSMHKENVDVVHNLRKEYRSYLGQGIPHQWIFPNPPGQNIPSCQDLKENLRKYLLPLFHKNKGNCHCCEKNYLLECPDKSETKNRNCTCKTCHSNNTNVGDQCNCIEILQTWVSKNTHLKEKRQREGRKKSIKCRNSLNGCETDDERSSCSSSATCFFTRNFATNGSVSSSERHYRNVFSREFLQKGCIKDFFPYISGSKRLRFTNKKTASKEIQTEVIGDTKLVQTENAENKIQASTKCFRCNLYQCQQSICKINSLEKTLYISPNVLQNHAVVCPNACHKRLCDKYSLEKKERKKKEKIRKEGSSGDYQGNFKMEGSFLNASKLSECYKCPQSQTLENIFKINNSACPQSYLKNFNNLKYLTDSRLKNYLRMRETLRRHKTDLPLNETTNQGEKNSFSQKFGKFKFLHYKPNETSCTESPRMNDFGVTPQKQDIGVTANTQENEILTKYFNDIQDSDGSRTYGLVRIHKNRKRRKLACGRRRKKLVNKNTQVGRGELTKRCEKSSGDDKNHGRRIMESNAKCKQAADGYKIPERGTLVELFKPAGFGKVSPESRRRPLLLKFKGGDLLIEKPKD